MFSEIERDIQAMLERRKAGIPDTWTILDTEDEFRYERGNFQEALELMWNLADRHPEKIFVIENDCGIPIIDSNRGR